MARRDPRRKAIDLLRDAIFSKTMPSAANSPRRSPSARARASMSTSSTTGSARSARARCGRSSSLPARRFAASIRCASIVRSAGSRAITARRSSSMAAWRSSRDFASARAGMATPAAAMEPWRDTGVEIHGPAVTEIAQAFAQVWLACGGGALRNEPQTSAASIGPRGDTRMRVIAGAPNATGTYRLDLVIASFARRHLWLTDAYFVGTAAYVQALAAAARDGVDVRLAGARARATFRRCRRCRVQAIGRCCRRACACSNGTARCCMRRARSPTDSGRASGRPISTSRAGWAITSSTSPSRTPAFASAMAAQFEADLTRATEIVLTRRNRVRPRRRRGASREARGARCREALGAPPRERSASAARSARRSPDRRVLDSAESGLLAKMGGAILALVDRRRDLAAFRRVAGGRVGAWLGIAWLRRRSRFAAAHGGGSAEQGIADDAGPRDGDPPG